MPELRWALTLPFTGIALSEHEEQRARLEAFTDGGITTPVLTFLSGPDRLPGLIDAMAP